MLVLATFGMEMVECGGAIAKHVRAGGSAYAAITFAPEEARSQHEAAARVLHVAELHFVDFEAGNLPAGAAAKVPFVRLVREKRPAIVITQDPVHAFGDLDPGRREIMTVYLEALALAGRPWRVAECGGYEPHLIKALYYMTPTTPTCVVDVSDVWDIKERAMDQLTSQMRFSGEYFKRSFGDASRFLSPGVDPKADTAAFGRSMHKAIDLAYHVASAVHTHTPFVLAEPYRREGLFPFARLPE